MDSEELFGEIDNAQSVTQKYLGLSSNKFFGLFFIVVALGIYVGVILYGANSMEVLFGLQDYETYLQAETTRLKNENAELQREYFELREISAQ
jgi:uncharacterized short protein YbdD (DUF466 family)